MLSEANVNYTLGKRYKFRFTDVFDITRRTKSGILPFRSDAPSEIRRTGYYVWYHPAFGYFYAGISSSASGVMSRWGSHLTKILNDCWKNNGDSKDKWKQPVNWRDFQLKWTSLGYGLEDTKDIIINVFPVGSFADFPDDTRTRPQFKAALKPLEHRIITMLNPYCNSEHDPNKPSSTKFPTVGKIDVDLEDNN